MGAKGGLALKGIQWFVRAVQFLSCALILAVYSYILATLHNHGLHIATSSRAVEGISGAGVLYAIVGLLLLCFVAGVAFASLFAIILDVAFLGAFIYVAIVNRHGASSCKGYIDTPYGRGNGGQHVKGDGGFTHLPSFHTACRLQTACLAVSIILIFFYIFSILVELALVRHHRKEKHFGPSPQNNYTTGYGSEKNAGRRGGFLSRLLPRRGTKRSAKGPDVLPEHTHPAQLDHTAAARQSYGTENTAVGHDAAGDQYVKPERASWHTGPVVNRPAGTYSDGIYNRP